MKFAQFPSRLGCIAAAAILSACGGTSSFDPAAGAPAAAPGAPAAPAAPLATGATVSGTSFKGPTAGATVCMYRIDNAADDKKGAKIAAQAGSLPKLADGCVVTANDGSYSFVLPEGASGDLLVESAGGTYCSDESVFDGAACGGGGGTPIAMGSNVLRTVVTAGAGATVANAPLTLLTTAAAVGLKKLSADAFKANYATVATGMGITDGKPDSDPNAAGKLKTALARLASYIGADSSVLPDIVSGIREEDIQGSEEKLSVRSAIGCAALANLDVTGTTGGGVQAFVPPGAAAAVALPVPVNVTRLFACKREQKRSRLVSYLFEGVQGMAPLAGGGTASGSYTERTYPTLDCSGEPVDIKGTSFTAVSQSQAQQIPFSASTDGAKSQSGQATRISITYAASGDFGPQRTARHLFCRTEANVFPIGLPQFRGYFTTEGSALKDGWLSRIDASSLFTGDAGQN